MPGTVDEHDHVETTPLLPDYLTSPDAVFKDDGVKWRYGKPPDYSKTRQFGAEGRKSHHAAGSLPQLVENLVKNWEVEASFKPRLQDWRTIDHENYSFAMNGGAAQSAEHMLRVGTYNAIIVPNEYYSPEHCDFAASHKTFKRMMPTFAWEVLEVYSGPPTVAFKWRHWGEMKNDYTARNDKGEQFTAKAHGGIIEIFGITTATVDENVRLRSVHTWMDPLAMFRQIAPKGVAQEMVLGGAVGGGSDDEAISQSNGVMVAEAPNEANNLSAEDGDAVPKAVVTTTVDGESGNEDHATNTPVSQAGGCPFMPSSPEESNLETGQEGPDRIPPVSTESERKNRDEPLAYQMPCPIQWLTPDSLDPIIVPGACNMSETDFQEQKNDRVGEDPNPQHPSSEQEEQAEGVEQPILTVDAEAPAEGNSEVDQQAPEVRESAYAQPGIGTREEASDAPLPVCPYSAEGEVGPGFGDVSVRGVSAADELIGTRHDSGHSDEETAPPPEDVKNRVASFAAETDFAPTDVGMTQRAEENMRAVAKGEREVAENRV